MFTADSLWNRFALWPKEACSLQPGVHAGQVPRGRSRRCFPKGLLTPQGSADVGQRQLGAQAAAPASQAKPLAQRLSLSPRGARSQETGAGARGAGAGREAVHAVQASRSVLSLRPVRFIFTSYKFLVLLPSLRPGPSLWPGWEVPGLDLRMSLSADDRRW